MNTVSKKLCLALASAAFLLTGCSKKPTRPSPNQTVLGPNSGGQINPSDVVSPTDASAAGLQDRLPDGAIDDGHTIRGLLGAVYFDFDKSSIAEKERPKLQAAKEYLEKNPGTRILLEGHCDWRGTAEYNLGLGDHRAASAKKYLGTIGVAADKLETLSKGSLEAAKNGDDAAMAKDRRAEIVIIKALPAQK